MPGTIAFSLPSQSLRTPSKPDSIIEIIPMPVDMRAGQHIGVYFEAGADIPEQFAGGVKWNLPKDKMLPQVCGEGITISDVDNYKQLSAAKDGALIALEAGLKISKVYEVAGDLDKRSGNITTPFSVLIHGSLSHGVSVTSKGDVEIRGLVEEAVIDAEGSIYAKGGVTGGGGAKLSAAKDVHCQFVQNSRIEGGGNVTVDSYLMNSTVLCGKKLAIPKDGFMVGGKAIVAESMEAGRLGSEAAVTTEIELGKNPFFQVQRELESKAVKELEREIEVLIASIRYSENALGDLVSFDETDPVTSLFKCAEAYKREENNLDDEKKLLLEKFGGAIMSLMRKKEALKVKNVAIEGLKASGANNFSSAAKLVVAGTAHPGVVVRMSDAFLKLDREYDYSTFFYKKAEGDAKVGEIGIK
jgi:uncharacterized protein (DUF342 family)